MEQRDWQQGWRRLRWRLRGAWQWPTFLALTLADGLVLLLLPFYDPGPGGLYPSLLLAGAANLFAVAIAAPLAGRLVRSRRRDLPRVVARDYAGTILLVAIAAALVTGGLLHRPAAAAAEADRAAVLHSLHAYVMTQAPELHDQLGSADTVQLEAKLYRACVPRHRPGRYLCLFVSTDQQPPGITLDRDQASNSAVPAR